MTYTSSLALVAFLALGSLAGCSATSEEGPASDSSNVIVANSDLLDQTIMKGTLTVGETSKVAYSPDVYKETSINGVPYLAWELVAPTAEATSGLKTQSTPFDTATITIGVVGDFPGQPDVVIVDKNFTVLGATKGRSIGNSEEAQIVVDTTGNAPKFVLVRDMIWVAPMDFEISVAKQ